MKSPSLRVNGIIAAAGSAFFLGLTPIFGKQSILLGFTPLAAVTVRTCLAAFLLFCFILFFKRSLFYIYPFGLVGCLVAGFINGLGSILYYTALSRIDASVGQLLYSFYPLFVALWLFLDRQSVNRITLVRLILILPGVYLLLSNPQKSIDLIGAGLMFAAALFYALHLLINQRILYEAPAPTVTFYTLLSMSLTVTVAFLIFHPSFPPMGTPWWPLLSLALITFLSRIALFQGVKQLGGMQTSLLGLGELLVTVVFARLLLHETLELTQWLGALLIGLNMLLVAYDKPTAVKRTGKGFLFWLNPPSITPNDYPFQNQ